MPKQNNSKHTASCSNNPIVEKRCPKGTGCRAKAFSPMKSDPVLDYKAVKAMSIPERKASALRNMRKFNIDKNRKDLERHVPMVDKKWNGNIDDLYNHYEGDQNDPILNHLVSAKNGKKGHILGFACYPLQKHQKEFAKNNIAYKEAFSNAGEICKGIELTPIEKQRAMDNNVKLGIAKRQKMNKCMSISIKTQIGDKVEPEWLPKVGITREEERKLVQMKRKRKK